MRPFKASFGIVACAAILMLLGVDSAYGQTKASTSAVKAGGYRSFFLDSIADIPGWSSKLQAKLKAIGTSIDQQKAKQALLPVVTDIQTTLSGLEDHNQKLLEEMNEKPVDTDAMRKTVNKLSDQISALESEFGRLRAATEAIGIPELAQQERVSEGPVHGKRAAISTLRQLGYDDEAAWTGANSAKLNNQGMQLLNLLHQAQDSFGKLHQMLAS